MWDTLGRGGVFSGCGTEVPGNPTWVSGAGAAPGAPHDRVEVVSDR